MNNIRRIRSKIRQKQIKKALVINIHHPLRDSLKVKVFKEELRNLYASPNNIMVIKLWRMRGEGQVARMENMRNVYKILVGKSEGKKPPGRPRRRWQNNITMHLREIRRKGVDWMYQAQDKDKWRSLVNRVMKLGVPLKAENFLNI
jgi:hypothetical protein